MIRIQFSIYLLVNYLEPKTNENTPDIINPTILYRQFNEFVRRHSPSTGLKGNSTRYQEIILNEECRDNYNDSLKWKIKY